MNKDLPIPATIQAGDYDPHKLRYLYDDAKLQLDYHKHIRIAVNHNGNLRIIDITRQRWEEIKDELGFQEFVKIMAEGAERVLFWADELHDIEVSRQIAMERLYIVPGKEE